MSFPLIFITTILNSESVITVHPKPVGQSGNGKVLRRTFPSSLDVRVASSPLPSRPFHLSPRAFARNTRQRKPRYFSRYTRGSCLNPTTLPMLIPFILLKGKVTIWLPAFRIDFEAAVTVRLARLPIASRRVDLVRFSRWWDRIKDSSPRDGASGKLKIKLTGDPRKQRLEDSAYSGITEAIDGASWIYNLMKFRILRTMNLYTLLHTVCRVRWKYSNVKVIKTSKQLLATELDQIQRK